MKIILLKENLKTGLLIMEKVASSNLSLPILRNVLIKTNTKVQLTTTDLEMAITHFISGKIEESGSITIPVTTLSEIANNLKSEKIILEKKNKNLLLKTDNYEALLQGIDEEEFPIIPKIKNKDEFIEINSNLLANSLESVITAASFSEVRPEISGVLFSFEPGVIKLVATDSFRLAEKTINQEQLKINFEKGFKTIIPLKTVDALIRVIKQQETERVKIYFDSNQVLFCINDTEIISRLIGGNFPDYQQIIPKDLKTKITIKNQELIDAIKISGAFIPRSNEIKITTNKDHKFLEIFSQDSSLGENRYRVPAEIEGSDRVISFNWRYLIDGLRSIKEEELFLGISEETKPTLIKAAKNPSFFYILMPLKSS